MVVHFQPCIDTLVGFKTRLFRYILHSICFSLKKKKNECISISILKPHLKSNYILRNKLKLGNSNPNCLSSSPKKSNHQTVHIQEALTKTKIQKKTFLGKIFCQENEDEIQLCPSSFPGSKIYRFYLINFSSYNKIIHTQTSCKFKIPKLQTLKLRFLYENSVNQVNMRWWLKEVEE